MLSFLMVLSCFGQHPAPKEKTREIDSVKQLLFDTSSSLVKVEHMITLGELYLNGKTTSSKDMESAFRYADEILNLGKQTGNFETQIKGSILHAKVLQVRGQYDDATSLLYEKIEIAVRNQSDKSTALLHKALGELFRDRGFNTGEVCNLYESEIHLNNSINYGKNVLGVNKFVETSLGLASILFYTYDNEKAVKILLDIVNQYEENIELDPFLLAKTYTNLAMNYRKLDLNEKASSFAKKALEANEHPSNTYLAYKILGQVSEKQNNLIAARNYYRKALNQIEEVDIHKVYNLLERLGNTSLELKDYSTSIKYYKRAIENSKLFPKAYGALSIPSQYGLSQAYYRNGQLSQSKKITHQIIVFLSGNDDNFEHRKYREVLRDAHLLMSQLHEEEKNYKTSLTYHKQFARIQKEIEHHRDSVYNLEKLKTIEELELAFETEKKDKEISMLKVNSTLQDEKNKQQGNFAIGLALGSIFLLTLLFIVLKALNLKQVAHKTIKEKYEENKLLMGEIHHRVKNNLQIIISLLNAQINSAKGDKELQVALKESQTKIKSMAIIHQSLYNSQTYTKVKVNNYFAELLNQVSQTFETENKSIQFETNVENKEINMSMAVPVGLIVNELVTNSYKYAFNQSLKSNRIIVNFNSTEKPDTYKLVVLDNGIGLPDDFDIEKLTSFGMQLVRGLVDQLHGTISIIKSQGTGYEIFIKEPEAA